MTVATKKSLSSSESGSYSYCSTVRVPQNIARVRPGSLSVSLDTSMAALLQVFKRYLRMQSCRSSDLARASNFDVSAPAWDEDVQLVLKSLPWNVRRLRKSKNFAHDTLSFRDRKDTVKFMGQLLRPCGHAIFSCTAWQLSLWLTSFFAHKSTRNDGSSSSPASRSRNTLMVSAAPLAFADYTLLHRDILARKSCALATAVYFALHVKENELPLTAEDRM